MFSFEVTKSCVSVVKAMYIKLFSLVDFLRRNMNIDG